MMAGNAFDRDDVAPKALEARQKDFHFSCNPGGNFR
jgi:hypothetical protein